MGIKIPIRGIKNNKGEWEDGLLTYAEIQALNTPFLVASIMLFQDWSVFKTLPHGKGTMDERETVLEIIKILTGEENEFNNWEMSQKLKKK